MISSASCDHQAMRLRARGVFKLRTLGRERLPAKTKAPPSECMVLATTRHVPSTPYWLKPKVCEPHCRESPGLGEGCAWGLAWDESHAGYGRFWKLLCRCGRGTQESENAPINVQSSAELRSLRSAVATMLTAWPAQALYYMFSE